MGTRKTIFVTGATGFIGRYVVENLLRRDARVIALVQPLTRTTKADRISTLDTIAKSMGELVWVDGDITQPKLGLQPADQIQVLQAEHIFHLAALYDLEATRESLTKINTDGTRQLCSWLTASSFKGALHHVSSIAVAGNFQGVFTEDMFEAGQDFPHPYHQTKYDSERLVRESGLKYNIYRPGSVVGHSKNGAIDRIDGIYHSFPLLLKISKSLPSWVKIPAPAVKGGLNIVPVDFVADALTHIALSEPKAQACFHLTDPHGPSVIKLINILLREAKGPQFMKLPSSMGAPGPAKAFTMMPIFQEIKESLFSELGLPSGATMNALNLKVRFDATGTQAALNGTAISCPPVKTYAKHLQRYYEDHLDPDNHRLETYRTRFNQKNILITGASRGIGKSAALEAANAGAHVILVARSAEDLKDLKNEIESSGGKATAIATDLSSQDEIDQLIATVENEFGGIDALIHNAARSIRRPIAESRDRHHDYERTMRLNYFAPVRLTLGLLPGLVEREGSVVMVLTLGVLMPGPFFGAYLPTKAALDIFGDVLAAEYAHANLHVGSVYLPLVKTAMMAPTKEYQNRVDLMTPEKAAHMILDSVAFRKRRVMLPVGRVFSFANRLAPGPTTRVLNLLRRTFPAKGENTEFPMEQAIITQVIGGSPI